jgi:hypothetical protein
MPQCGQMRTRAQSGPPFHTPKNPTVPGISRKSSFCHRTQAPRDQKNTDSFPGFRTRPSRVSALQPGIAQHQCTHTLSGIPVREPGRNKKSKKCETNRTQAQEDSQAANPAPASVFIRLTGPLYGGLSGLSVAKKSVFPDPARPSAFGAEEISHRVRPGTVSGYPPGTSPVPHRATAARSIDSAETECPRGGRGCEASGSRSPYTFLPRCRASEGQEHFPRMVICQITIAIFHARQSRPRDLSSYFCGWD